MGDETYAAYCDSRSRVILREVELQERHLRTVSQRIGAAIIEFCGKRELFHADELREFVATKCGQTAPGSADRVLRDMRQQGLVNYEVVNRAKSLYRVLL